MVEATGAVLFLYRPVAWCFLQGMKYLSILIVGVAMLFGGCGESEADKLKKEIQELKETQKILDLRQELADLKKGPTVNVYQTEYKSELRYLKGEEGPFTGTTVNYFEDGSKEFEFPYVDGKKHGTQISYYPDGSKRYEIPYVNGKRHGTEIWYNKDGSRNEYPYWNGKLHGTAIGYYEDGTKAGEGNYVNDKEQGIRIRYYKNGSKMEETPFLDGKEHGTAIKYREDGSKETETVWKNGWEVSTKKF